MSIFFRETIYSTILTTNIQSGKLKYLVTDILNIKKTYMLTSYHTFSGIVVYFIILFLSLLGSYSILT